MRKRIVMLLLAAGITVCLSGNLSAQIIPTPWWAGFYDSLYLSTFNGDSLPPGSIIQAYDPQDVLCGQDTVGVAGTFGFMSVYGDDVANTPAVDEGAVDGDSIRFKVNGRWATVTGDNTWADQVLRPVSLSVTGAVVAFSALSLPRDTLVPFNDTIMLYGRIQNNGDGLDFYGVNVTDSKGWEIIYPVQYNYAGQGQWVDVWFGVVVPTWPGIDTVEHVYYSFFSHLDTSQHIDDSCILFVSITDVNDGSSSLPNGFTLFQNYPNPFNPSTVVSFSLPSRSAVQFEVYDMLGRQVEFRDLGSLNSGNHEIEFDASSLASGVYLYRIVTEEASLSRKMMLVK
ncbi:MAG: T9SS type A sorting domain-containing protein [Candidatus Zixiibacteriota bacterium]